MKIRNMIYFTEKTMQHLPKRSIFQPVMLTGLIFASAFALSAADPAADSKAVEKPAATAPAAKPVDKTKEKTADAKRLAFTEAVDRQENDARAEEARDNGRKLALAGKYKEAIDEFLKAKEIYEGVGAVLPERYREPLEGLKRDIAFAYYDWAKSLYEESRKLAREAKELKSAQKRAGEDKTELSTGGATYIEKIDSAIAKCEEAQKMYPLCKDITDKAIAEYKQMKKSMEFDYATSMEQADPDGVYRKTDIELLIQQGRTYYKIGRWDKARDTFNAVLAQEPYNAVAIDYIRKSLLKMIQVGQQRQLTTVAERTDEVLWKPIAPILSTADTGGVQGGTLTNKLDNTKNIRKKLESIRLDNLVFEDAPITAVVKYLRERSRTLDADNDHSGVNFVLRLENPEGAAPVESSDDSSDSSDEEDSGDAESTGDAAGGQVPLVNITMADQKNSITLLQAINAVCTSAELRYQVEEYAVVIAGKNVHLEDCTTVVYPVDKEVMDSIPTDSEDPVKTYFIEHGVTFDAGSNVVYDESISRLIVTNTSENQQKVHNVIEEMNRQNDPQIQVQVKFIEVGMNDLEELGFEYVVSRPANTIPAMTAIAAGDYTAAQDTLISQVGTENAGSFTDTKNGVTIINDGKTTYSSPTFVKKGYSYTIPSTGNYASTYYYKNIAGKTRTFDANDSLVRNAQDDGRSYGVEDNSRTDTVFNWQHTNTNGYNWDVKIHALDQADSTNLLSSPRVTTMNGQAATIKMVTEKYYPESWGDAELDNVNGLLVFVPSTPSFGDAVEEGISMEVEPKTDDNFTIQMTMKPVILEFAGWTDYSYIVPMDEGTVTNTLKMPIIEARTVTTEVRLFDGETIVLGGVIKDQVNAVNDQYPILGDIPIVGRLFQSRGKGSKKTNLLVFLTASLVNPDGTTYRPPKERGLPTF